MTDNLNSTDLPQTLRLIGPRVLVLRDPPIEATEGGLVIPTEAQTPKQKVLEGTVLKIGPGRTSRKGVLVPMSVAPGDRVIYGFLDGHDFEEDGKQYVILEDSEIRAITTVIPTSIYDQSCRVTL